MFRSQYLSIDHQLAINHYARNVSLPDGKHTYGCHLQALHPSARRGKLGGVRQYSLQRDPGPCACRQLSVPVDSMVNGAPGVVVLVNAKQFLPMHDPIIATDLPFLPSACPNHRHDLLSPTEHDF
jgi:hypothetical protein